MDKYFFADSPSPLNDKQTKLIIKDGFAYLSKNRQKYDIIIVDIEDPATAHSSPLYTVEGFMLANKNLAQGGILTLNGIGKNDEYLKILYHSLRSVFNYVQFTVRNNLIFIASNTELTNNFTSDLQRQKMVIINKKPIRINTINNQILKYIYYDNE